VHRKTQSLHIDDPIEGVEKAGMSSSAGARVNHGNQGGMTLIEMLCVIAIIALLAAMLLPALQRGKSKAQQIRCLSNLRQIGLASLSFAHSHEDKFPVQVTTNQGGSLEYLQAASALSGEFYFSYRHFLPLATELDTPKVLRCPADVRNEATNFASLRNENLSYFVGANPVYGRSDSALSGDRNLSPLYGTMVRVGGLVNLKWTEEMHQHRGNVLFADGHVEQRKDLFNPVESTNGTITTIVMPTVKTVTPGSATGGQSGGEEEHQEGRSLFLLPRPVLRRCATRIPMRRPSQTSLPPICPLRQLPAMPAMALLFPARPWAVVATSARHQLDSRHPRRPPTALTAN